MLDLKPRLTRNAQVDEPGEVAWRLSIPAGPAGRYRLAQLDDYRGLRRGRFPWRAPLRVSLRARVSAPDLPGTWGFGLWNDPFSASLGLGGMGQRIPTLPDAVWFFYASPPNYLSFRDDLPAQGFLAATFRSSGLPGWLLAPGGLAAPLFLLPPGARLLRRVLRRLVQQDTRLVSQAVTDWHTYTLDWEIGRVTLQVDGETALETTVAPCGPLALVLWIDNQYAALPPSGRLAFGSLANPQPAWLEISDFSVFRADSPPAMR